MRSFVRSAKEGSRLRLARAAFAPSLQDRVARRAGQSLVGSVTCSHGRQTCNSPQSLPARLWATHINGLSQREVDGRWRRIPGCAPTTIFRGAGRNLKRDAKDVRSGTGSFRAESARTVVGLVETTLLYGAWKRRLGIVATCEAPQPITIKRCHSLLTDGPPRTIFSHRGRFSMSCIV
jgi:hypothetical protein